MNKMVGFQTFANSQDAIQNYMKLKYKNAFMHEAKVLVYYRKKIKYNAILNVTPRIETNHSSVEIIPNDKQFERDYYLKYTNKYQIFMFIEGTLLISCKDRFENPIEIHIRNV